MFHIGQPCSEEYDQFSLIQKFRHNLSIFFGTAIVSVVQSFGLVSMVMYHPKQFVRSYRADKMRKQSADSIKELKHQEVRYYKILDKSAEQLHQESMQLDYSGADIYELGMTLHDYGELDWIRRNKNRLPYIQNVDERVGLLANAITRQLGSFGADLSRRGISGQTLLDVLQTIGDLRQRKLEDDPSLQPDYYLFKQEYEAEIAYYIFGIDPDCNGDGLQADPRVAFLYDWFLQVNRRHFNWFKQTYVDL